MTIKFIHNVDMDMFVRTLNMNISAVKQRILKVLQVTAEVPKSFIRFKFDQEARTWSHWQKI